MPIGTTDKALGASSSDPPVAPTVMCGPGSPLTHPELLLLKVLATEGTHVDGLTLKAA